MICYFRFRIHHWANHHVHGLYWYCKSRLLQRELIRNWLLLLSLILTLLSLLLQCSWWDNLCTNNFILCWSNYCIIWLVLCSISLYLSEILLRHSISTHKLWKMRCVKRGWHHHGRRHSHIVLLEIWHTIRWSEIRLSVSIHIHSSSATSH